MATINMDPYLVQWIKEWIQHQKLVAEIENLGKPVFELPPTTLPWDLPQSDLQESMDRDTLQGSAHHHIDLQVRRVDSLIEELNNIKARYKDMRDLL